MFNVFANEAVKAANMTYTENGHVAASTTGSAVLDLYGVAGALRGQDEELIFDLFDKAYKEDPLLTARTLFYMRDCRGGTGERDTFRKLLKYAAKKYPDILEKNVGLIPEYGRWDDMYALVETPMENGMFEIMRHQLIEDIGNVAYKDRPVSLLGKWMKSCNTSSPESRKLGKLTCRKMGFVNEKGYRQVLTTLRERIRIVETQMSSNHWKDIEYDKVPSRAGLIYRNAFKKHDEARYNEYIQSVQKGEKKINVAMNTPQDLVHAYMVSEWGCRLKEEDPTIEVMWKNQPDYIQSDENVLVMADVSGSMHGRPIEVSCGLAMYFAQKNRGAFHNLFMTFESRPQFVSINDNLSFHDNLKNVMNAPWGGSTNLNLACEAMLMFAKGARVPQCDMPTRLIIVSDMEIDEAAGYWHANRSTMNGILHIKELQKMYETAGYKVPQIIYWNVESRDNHFHTTCDVKGTMLASGSSPAVFEAVMKMKDLDVTPLDAMLEVLNSERYSRIQI